MIDATLPGPDALRTRQEHVVADPDRPRGLLNAIPDEPDTLARLRGRHLLSVSDLDAPLVRQLMRLTALYELGEIRRDPPLRCKVLSNLFLDHSHCTGRLSFNAAWLRLGGNLLDFEPTVDRILSRRHAWDEIVELCNSYSDLTVLRTADPETFQDMLLRFRVPVINAGDGQGEHPTHALADLYTLFKWRPGLLQDDPPREQRLQIAISGDPSQTRTIRSFLRLLTLFPQAIERIIVVQRLARCFADGQREELERAGLRVDTLDEMCPATADMDVAWELLPAIDVLYVHQLHPERLSRMQLTESFALLKPDAMVLNPEIQNENAAQLLNESPHNGYYAQGRGSLFLRMAVFAAIVG
jgi:aspartate carbamoyltransferase catalytic subunit